MIRDPESTRTDDVDRLVELSHRIASAIQRRDLAELTPLLDTDFVQMQAGTGERSKAAFLEAVASFGSVIERLTLSDLRVRLLGDAAVVTGVQRATVRTSSGRVEGATAFVDIFARRGGQWLLAVAFGADLAGPAS